MPLGMRWWGGGQRSWSQLIRGSIGPALKGQFHHILSLSFQALLGRKCSQILSLSLVYQFRAVSSLIRTNVTIILSGKSQCISFSRFLC